MGNFRFPKYLLGSSTVLTTLNEGKESGDMTKRELEDGSFTVMMGNSHTEFTLHGSYMSLM